MEATMKFIEIIFLVSGMMFISTGIIQYGRRTSDWFGVIRMFYRRISMSVVEYKWYRSGVACFVLGVIARVANLTFWPT
uniref:hypothetical protein n=1 Tax=Photobacterium sp. J15 TaxID=265901 RepID=UPI0018DC3D1C|nr:MULTISPECIES: hypothetical protein [Photobacterium]